MSVNEQHTRPWEIVRQQFHIEEKQRAMRDIDKSKEQLVSELAELRQRIARLDVSESERRQKEEIVIDFTRRKPAEEQLQASEERYRTLFKQANDAIYVTNQNDEIIDVNDRACKLLGYTREELLMMKIPDLQAPEVRGKEGTVIHSELAQHGGAPFETIDLHRDGRRIPVEISTSRLDGKEDGLVLSIVRDISERKRFEEALQRHNRELELLNRAVQAFGSTLDLDQVLSNVLAQVCQLLGVVAASIWLIESKKNIPDEGPGDLVCRQAVGPKSEVVCGRRLPAGQGIAGWVARHGDSLIVPDTGADKRHFKEVDREIGIDLRSIVAVPLRVSSPGTQQDVIGVLQVVDTGVNRFDVTHLALLEPLATSAAIAIENARLYEQAQLELVKRIRMGEEIVRRNRELGLLNQIIAASASAVEPKAILETACRELAQALEVPHAAATLFSADKSFAWVAAEYLAGGQPPVLNGALPVKGNPAFHYLLTHKAPLVVTDAQDDPRLAPIHDLMRRRGTNSLLMVPLIIEGEVAGSLSLEARETPYFSAAEVSLIWSVADQVSAALARAQLAQSYRQLSIAIEQAAESVIILDPQGTILYVNPAFGKVTGYSRAETIGRTLDMLRSGEHDPAFYQEMWATIRAGKVWHGRIVNKKKDGTLYTDDATITPVRDENGTIINHVQVTRDVTRELQLEEQFRQTQKMEAVGRLTAGIAHDFNNLLTAINGFAELAQFQLPPDAPAQELVGKVRQSGERAAGLVRQLLAFSATQVVEAKVVAPNAVVAEMDKMLRQIIGENIELTTHLAPELWTVKIDSSQLEQVIVNLAVNARDAMPRGGRLTIKTANVALEEGFVASHLEAEPGEYALLTVKDTGVGMSEAVKAHLFEPFFTTKERGKGTGLGLATVYGIVKQSGGHVWVDSQEGVGTTFKIYLPRCQAARRPLSQPREERTLPFGGETILVVEDDDQVRTMVRLVLTQQGYHVLEAADGQQALRRAADHADHIDLLVTDVVMLGMSGPELAHSLGQSYSHLKTLYISGYPDEAIAQHGLPAAGVTALQKPFTPMDLARKVRQVLDSR